MDKTKQKKNTTEKSIIDYILVSSTQKIIIENIEIDELGTLRIKGKMTLTTIPSQLQY